MSMFQKVAHRSLMTVSETLQFYQPPVIVSDVTQVTGLQRQSLGQSIAPTSERIRIIFVSCLCGGNEPHGQLILDLIQRLPSRIFESIAIGVGSKPPSDEFVEAVNGNFHFVGQNEERARAMLASQTPDCVIFVENINNPLMHFLAYERFAPIQVLLMGAPVTSGLGSIDYFLSGDRLEHVSFKIFVSNSLHSNF